jgi:integrase
VRLAPDEEERLVDALAECDNPEFWPMVELALTSSMRRGSLLLLEWVNVDLQHRQVRVWAKGFDVTLPLSQRAVDLLRRVPRTGSGRVFSMTANAVKLAWQRVRVRAGLPHLRFADLRHLAATFYARAGLNAHQLRLVLGHRTTHMAEVYVNLATSDVSEALDKAEGVRPVSRPLPPMDVHAGPPGRSIMAERRTTRLNGQQKFPSNVVRLPTSQREKKDE